MLLPSMCPVTYDMRPNVHPGPHLPLHGWPMPPAAAAAQRGTAQRAEAIRALPARTMPSN